MENSFLNVSVSSDRNNITFAGTPTKREIVIRLRNLNLMNDELMEPLNELENDDPLDVSLISYYSDIICGKGQDEEMNDAELSEELQEKNLEEDSFKSDVACASISKILDSLLTSVSGISTPNTDSMLESQSIIIPDNLFKSEESVTKISDVKTVKDWNNSIIDLTTDSSDDDRLPLNDFSLQNVDESKPNISNLSDVEEQSTVFDADSLGSVGLDVEKSLSKLDISDQSKCVSDEDVSNFVLNDTLEEMEMLLRHGVDYMNQNEVTPNSKVNVSENYSKTDLKNEHSLDAIEEPETFNNESAQNLGKSESPVEKENVVEASPSVTELEKSPAKFEKTPYKIKLSPRFGAIFMTPNSNKKLGPSSPSDNSKTDLKTEYSLDVIQETETFKGKSELPVEKRNIIEASPFFTKLEKSPAKVLKTPNKMQISPRIAAVFKTPISNNKLGPSSQLGAGANPFKSPNSAQKVQSDHQFKVPLRSPHYKNIRSPISVYIKNSPSLPFTESSVAPNIKTPIVFKAPNLDKKSSGVPQPTTLLPTRFYKPAPRKFIAAENKVPLLADNVRELIKGPVEPEITKHVGRVNEQNGAEPDSFSCNADVSEFSLLSSTDTSADVSVVIKKNVASQ